MIPPATSLINYSASESLIFGNRFGRFDIPNDFTDWKRLNEEIKLLNIDFLRIKISNPDNDVTNKIHELGKDAYLLEILRHYNSMDLVENDYDEAPYHNLEYKTVNHQNIEQFKQILAETYEDIPFGTYATSEVLKEFPLEKQKNNLVDYFANQYNGNHPDNVGYIIYFEGTAAGCLNTDYYKHHSYTSYLGILRPFRKKELYTKTFNFVMHQAKNRNLRFAHSAARLHNIFSQKGFEKYWNFNSYDWIYLIRC